MRSSACRSSIWCTRWAFVSSTNSPAWSRSASRRRTTSGIPQRSPRPTPRRESSAIRSPRMASSDLPLSAMLEITVGSLRLTARWESEAAPKPGPAFRRLLPLRAQLVQARWSGESAWIPLGDLQTGLGYENHTSYPGAGQLLLYTGGISEIEALVTYGSTSFASKAGPLAGNHFATIEEGQALLSELGRRVLYEGAQEVVFSEG